MDLAHQKKTFYETVLPSRPNEWEVDDIFELLEEMDHRARDLLLSHVAAIWPVSHSLCFAYLSDGRTAALQVSAELFPVWVRQLLGIYETSGLTGARRFMADVEHSFLGPLKGRSAVHHLDILAQMSHYIRGISGKSLPLEVSSTAYTDSENIYVPPVIDLLPDRCDNELLYKLIISLQWGQLNSGLFGVIADVFEGCDGEPGTSLETRLFSAYREPALAKELLIAVQFVKVYGYLTQQLPGLIHRSRRLVTTMVENSYGGKGGRGRSCALRGILQMAMGSKKTGSLWNFSLGPEELREKIVTTPSLEMVTELYPEVAGLAGGYEPGPVGLVIGTFDFGAVAAKVTAMRQKRKGRFVALLAETVETTAADRDEGEQGAVAPGDIVDTMLPLLNKDPTVQESSSREQLVLDNGGSDIPHELIDLAAEIMADLGAIPEAYVQAAAGISTGGFHGRHSTAVRKESGASPSAAGFSYDEWDYRRGGYRKDWCTLYEKELNLVLSSFVRVTREKYRPQLLRLRRQFEMLKTRDRFVRRNRHGDDIDLDAVIDALGDTRAGLTPSDRLLIRLLRDERDISSLFLVDMSNSTEGWIGLAMKEALVLLTEALEVVGDPYGIYGFSGMRRSKSEIYHVKHMEEPFSREVQQRIAAMKPMEYTRMGPAIRHLSDKLLRCSSRVRLLLVISDGKPEDYDDYKGQYAIEDTKKALLEARGNGLYPFCITIDRAAQDYLTYMFGKGNYIFVDNVLSLPGKMADMYRLLTT